VRHPPPHPPAGLGGGCPRQPRTRGGAAPRLPHPAGLVPPSTKWLVGYMTAFIKLNNNSSALLGCCSCSLLEWRYASFQREHVPAPEPSCLRPALKNLRSLAAHAVSGNPLLPNEHAAASLRRNQSSHNRKIDSCEVSCLICFAVFTTETKPDHNQINQIMRECQS
jgi:hypothetical protein